MDKTSFKISELTASTTVPETGALPVAVPGTNAETVQISVNQLRSVLNFETAFSSPGVGVTSTARGEIFFTYSDSTQTEVLVWINQGNSSYSPVTDEAGVQLSYFANNYPLQGFLNTLSSLLSIATDEIAYLKVGAVLDNLTLVADAGDKRLFLIEQATGTLISWVLDTNGCTVTTSAGVFYLSNYVVFGTAGNQGVNVDVNELIPTPGEAQTVVEINFGGQKNSGTLGLDSRGRLSVGVKVEGLQSAKGVSIPFSEGTGYFNGPYQDTIARFPIKGMSDDDTTHGLIFSYDKVKGLPILYAVSPLQYDKQGLVNQGTKYAYGTPLYHQTREMAQLDSIGRSLSDSFDAWYIFNNTGIRYHRMAVITNPSSNQAGVVFSGILTIGNWSTHTVQPYMVTVSGHNIAASSTNSVNNLKYRMKFTQINGDLDTTTSADEPQLGLTMTGTGVMEVWLKIPVNASRLSYMSINSGNRDQVAFNFSLLYTRYTDLLAIAPSNVVWKTPGMTYTSDNCFMANDGSVHRFLGGGLLRVGNANIFTNRPDILSEDFVKGGTLHAYKNNNDNMPAVTVTVDSNNLYTVTGVGYRWDTFRFIPPKGFYDPTLYSIKLESTGTKTFTFSVRTRTYTLTNTAVANNVVTSGAITAGYSDPVAIPDYMWVDLSVQW